VEAHEGGLAKIDATDAILLQERLKALSAFGFCKIAPIISLDRNLDSIDHLLHGIRDAFPAEAAAQNRMSLDDPLQARRKHASSAARATSRSLLDIDAGISPAHGVVEHPRLHRR